MRPSRLPALPRLLWPLLCAACAAPPAPVLLRPEIPADLLECQPQPDPPATVRTDADLAAWIVDLATAGDDCRARLGRLKDLLQ